MLAATNQNADIPGTYMHLVHSYVEPPEKNNNIEITQAAIKNEKKAENTKSNVRRMLMISITINQPNTISQTCIHPQQCATRSQPNQPTNCHTTDIKLQ